MHHITARLHESDQTAATQRTTSGIEGRPTARKRARAAAVIAVLTLSVASLAACGGSGDGGSGSSGTAASGAGTTGGEATGAGTCQPAGEPVTITFTSWIPQFQEIVDLWNSTHPDIQVQYTEVPEGSSGTYQNYMNQIKSGKTDDLAFIGYETLPSFLVQGGLRDFSDCAGVMEAKEQFLDSVWDLTSIGDPNAVYALGVDYGPDALYYRTDLFADAGIEVPTTWDEFYQAGQQIHDLGGHIMNVDAAGCPTFWPTLFQQSGAQWFSRDEESWTVNLAGDDSKQAADYLQKLIAEDLVTTYACFGDEYTKAYNTGEIWTTPGA
ncbi:MAG: extracellular solute-binding protein, partial [Bifidobacteriaceae bacterium]|nr:extracellular solute-binding protein [Bifidobacteriaceae bacterium]